jgi:phage tail-like protein
MTEFPVNPTRFDPYKQFKFRVKWDGRFVAGVSKVTALRRTTDVIEHREGGKAQHDHLTARFAAITLERGLTQDTEFEAGQQGLEVRAGLGAEVSLADFRKDIVISCSTRPGGSCTPGSFAAGRPITW